MKKLKFQPENFRELCNLTANEPIFNAELRLESDSIYYQNFLKNVPKTIYLGLLKDEIDRNTKDGFALLKNRFPYTYLLEKLPTVHHYCLWFKEKTKQDVSNFLYSEIKHPICTLQNPNSNKSVLELDHIHVFILTTVSLN